ncbi:hypothetical protein C8R43DRAFT_943049 [Mycena crocata]|nr:hypothetical protein C8R43DRAFT_943049 [Mycena crocata]
MSRARLGLEARAWARPEAAWASELQAQARSPKQGLQAKAWAWARACPGIFHCTLTSILAQIQWPKVIFAPYSQARASGPGSGLEDLKPKPQARPSPLSGPARLGPPGPGLAGFRASGRALDITNHTSQVLTANEVILANSTQITVLAGTVRNFDREVKRTLTPDALELLHHWR